MKAIRRIISLTAVIALAFSMASCALLTKKANFTRKITVDNAAITIRDDMTEVNQIKNNDNYITGYKWSGYGLNVAKKSANDSSATKLYGQSGDDLLTAIGKANKNPSEIKKFDDISYMEMTVPDLNDKTKELFSIIYVKEVGYEYYFFEFYTSTKTGDKYRSEYETIMTSVKAVEEPPETLDVNIYNIILTMDGDAYEQSTGTWVCGRYAATVIDTNLTSKTASPEVFAKAMITNGIKTSDGGTPVIMTTPGGASYFEGMAEQTYATYFVKEINGKLYCIMLFTLVPTEELLKTEFITIVDAAHAA